MNEPKIFFCFHPTSAFLKSIAPLRECDWLIVSRRQLKDFCNSGDMVQFNIGVFFTSWLDTCITGGYIDVNDWNRVKFFEEMKPVGQKWVVIANHFKYSEWEIFDKCWTTTQFISLYHKIKLGQWDQKKLARYFL